MANGPPEYRDDPNAYRTDWERWRSRVDTRLEDTGRRVTQLETHDRRYLADVATLRADVKGIYKKLDGQASELSAVHSAVDTIAAKLGVKDDDDSGSNRKRIVIFGAGTLAAIGGVLGPLLTFFKKGS